MARSPARPPSRWRQALGRVVHVFLAGAILSLILMVVHHADPEPLEAVTSVQARLADFITYTLPTRSASTGAQGQARIVLVDFSEVGADVERRGSAVPRADIARLVQQADEAQARVVLIDFSLGGASDDNEALGAVLRSLRHAHVVVPAWLTRRMSSECWTAETEAVSERGHAERTLFGQLVLAGASARVWQGHDDVDTDADGRVRSVCPVVRAQWHGGSRSVVELPSTALLAAALSLESGKVAGATDCERPADLILSLARQARPGPESTDMGKPLCSPTGREMKHRRVAFVQDADRDPRSAHRLPESTFRHLKVTPGQPQRLDPETLKDAVVVIGASHELSADKVVTPLGVMPGAMLLVNMIHQGMTEGLGEQRELGLFALVPIELAVVLLGAVVFVGSRDAGEWLGRLLTGPRTSHAAHASHAATPEPLALRLLRGALGMAWALACAGLALVCVVYALVLLSGAAAADLPMAVDLSGGAVAMLLELGGRADEATKQLLESHHDPSDRHA